MSAHAARNYVKGTVFEGQSLDVTDLRVDPPRSLDLDHALGLVDTDHICTKIVHDSLRELSLPATDLYGAHWKLTRLTLRDSASLLGFAAGLGWLGAWLSVGRHLAQARPH